jgi:NADH-quinone oxidoreductase subunit E
VLSEAELKDLTEALPHYPSRRSAAITALKIVQRHRGWLSDEALDDVGGFLGVSSAELDTIATFYNLLFRRPVGRHVIFVCDSVVCWSLGHERLLAALRERLGIGLGETTPDDRFTLLPMVCLGACEKAPAMLVDDDLHGPMEPANLAAVLEQYA